MIRWVLVAIVLAGCGDTVVESPSTSDSTDSTFRFEFDPDQWSGEVEWDFVEECSLLGVSNCATRIEDMRAGECSVDATRQLLASLASSTPSEQAELVDKLLGRRDCAQLSSDSWQLREP